MYSNHYSHMTDHKWELCR